MEELIRAGYIQAVADITTTELADELVGGIFSAGPNRLTAAGEMGIPQVVSVGTLDMVNFGPPDTVPADFKDRKFYQHNPTTTLMRTTIQENAELGRILAEKLNRGTSPAVVVFPHGGVSLLDRQCAGSPCRFDDKRRDRCQNGADAGRIRRCSAAYPRRRQIGEPGHTRYLSRRSDFGTGGFGLCACQNEWRGRILRRFQH